MTYDKLLKAAWPVWDHASAVFGGALERGRAKRLSGDSLASYVVPFFVEWRATGWASLRATSTP